MPSKREKIYQKILSRKVVTFNEIIDESKEIIGEKDPKYIHDKYVRKLLEEGKLQRVRRDLYAVVPPLENKKDYNPDEFLVASKIKENYYLGYHTALDWYGCAYSRYNEVYIAVNAESRFDQFRHQGTRFRPVFVQDIDLGVEGKKHYGQVIRVSCKERTFIDCLDRPKYAGGWEESLKSLQRLDGLNFDRLIDILGQYEKDLLWRKTGLVLSLLKRHSVFYEHISDEVLKKLQSEIGENPMYLTDEGPHGYDARWHLYVPEDFEENLRGV